MSRSSVIGLELLFETGNALVEQIWAAEPPEPDLSSMGTNFGEIGKGRAVN